MITCVVEAERSPIQRDLRLVSGRFALRLANRAYVLGSGRVLAEDRAATLRANPSLLKAYLGA